MPWLLISLGIVVVCVGILLGNVTTVSSETTDRVAGKPVKVSETKSPFSDTLLVAVIALGGVLVVAGAFYTRISEVTFPGGAAIKLAQYQAAAAEAVARAELPSGASEETEVAARTAAATNLAIARTVELAILSEQGAIAGPPSGTAVGAVLPAPTREYWDSIAESVLRDALSDGGQPAEDAPAEG
jgi:hypothetical protein